MIARMVGRGASPAPPGSSGLQAGPRAPASGADPCVPGPGPQREGGLDLLIRSPASSVLEELAPGAAVAWPIPSSWSTAGAWQLGAGRVMGRYEAEDEPGVAADELASTWRAAGWEVVAPRRVEAGMLVLAVGESSTLTAYLRRRVGTKTMTRVTVMHEPRASWPSGAPRGSR
jgi:hypothetical protein